MGGEVLKLVEDFLKERTQRVKVDGVKSREEKIISGVPQGTVLGPVLFLVMIDDITDVVRDTKVASSIFADDTRLSMEINTEDDVEEFQDIMNKIKEWGKNNNMKFNAKKFELIRYGKNEELKDNTVYFGPDMKDVIERKENTRDLGVIINDKLNFNDHVDKVVQNTKRKMGLLSRTFKGREKGLMMKLWKTYCIPVLDYASPLYVNPEKKTQLKRLENLQRQWTKKIEGMNQMSYWERLKSTKLNSIERRNERFLIIYTWKILEGLVPNPGIEHTQNQRRGRVLKKPPVSKKNADVRNAKENSITVKAVNLFNSLLPELRNVTECSTLAFKNLLDSVLSEIPDTPNTENDKAEATDLITGKPSNKIEDWLRVTTITTDTLNRLILFANNIVNNPGNQEVTR